MSTTRPNNEIPTRPFPPGFLWGTATASYQIEGAVDVGRPRPLDLGHLQPQPRHGLERRHRRHRL